MASYALQTPPPVAHASRLGQKFVVVGLGGVLNNKNLDVWVNFLNTQNVLCVQKKGSILCDFYILILGLVWTVQILLIFTKCAASFNLFS